jgi:hypothetical protein
MLVVVCSLCCFNRMVPNIIRQGYTMISSFMKKQVEMPQANAQQGAAGGGGISSFLPKCTIM